MYFRIFVYSSDNSMIDGDVGVGLYLTLNTVEEKSVTTENVTSESLSTYSSVVSAQDDKGALSNIIKTMTSYGEKIPFTGDSKLTILVVLGVVCITLIGVLNFFDKKK